MTVSPRLTYAALEASGQAVIGHLDARCRDLVPGQRLAASDADPWPCARCVPLDALPPVVLGPLPPEKNPEVFPQELKVSGLPAENKGVSNRTPHPEDTTMARSTSTYGKSKAPVHTVVLAQFGLCPTHRTPLLEQGRECWDCGGAPVAPDFGALKAAFASAIADGIPGAAEVRQAALQAWRSGDMDANTVQSALDMIAGLRKHHARKVHGAAYDVLEDAVPGLVINREPGYAAPKATPAAPAPKPAGDVKGGAWTQVADGYYATVSRTGNNDLDFWAVSTVKSGDWAGFRSVSRVIGGRSDERVRGGERKAALEAIAADADAAKRYADELGACYRCNRHLTDETSRQLGIGPDCRSKGA